MSLLKTVSLIETVREVGGDGEVLRGQEVGGKGPAWKAQTAAPLRCYGD